MSDDQKPDNVVSLFKEIKPTDLATMTPATISSLEATPVLRNFVPKPVVIDGVAHPQLPRLQQMWIEMTIDTRSGKTSAPQHVWRDVETVYEQ